MNYLDDYTAEFKFGAGLLAKAKKLAKTDVKDLAKSAKSKMGGMKPSMSKGKSIPSIKKAAPGLKIADTSPRIAQKMAAKTDARLATSKAKLDAVPMSAGLSKQKGVGTYAAKPKASVPIGAKTTGLQGRMNAIAKKNQQNRAKMRARAA